MNTTVCTTHSESTQDIFGICTEDSISGPAGGDAPITSSTQDPLPQTPQVRGELSHISTQTDLTQIQTFSPKLCLELMSSLTPEQIDYEINWQKSAYGQNFDFRLRKPDNSAKTAELYRVLTPSVTLENSNIFYDCNEYQNVTHNFACLLQRAEECIAKLTENCLDVEEDEGDEFFDSQDFTDSDPPHMPDSRQVPQHPTLADPVCVLDIDFSDIQLDNILDGFNLNKVGSREVGYAGEFEYKYGNIRHPPRLILKISTLTAFFVNLVHT